MSQKNEIELNVIENMDEESIHDKLFSNVRHFFDTEKFCDLVIYGQFDGNESQFCGIKCHSIVLCSVAPFLKSLLLDHEEHEIFLPEISHEVIAQFVRDLYQGLSLPDLDLQINQDLAKALGLLHDEKNETKNEIIEMVLDEGQIQVTNTDFDLIIPNETQSGFSLQDGTILLDPLLVSFL